MDSKTLVIQYLDEAHAVESALVTNLRAHATMATNGPYKKLLERHLDETRTQVVAIERRLQDLGEDGGRGLLGQAMRFALDAVGQAVVLSKGPIDAMRTPSQAERMLKNARDDAATEALEIAAYDALESIATAAGDETTAKLAADHRATEERMLADLRKLLPKLAVSTFEDRTSEKARDKQKAAAAKAKPKTRSPSESSSTRRSTASES